MSDAKSECLAVVGVGLIGGSVGLAARRTGRYRPILGVDRDPVALERAKARGCIDEAAELPDAARRADVIVVCTPVDQIADQILTAARFCRAKTLLTDTGSTKAAIVADVEKGLARPRLFLGAHPLAGSEKRGPEYARENLFDGRLNVLTPTPQTLPAAVNRASAFWESLGCRLWSMPPEHHDQILAITSHLPHLVASALAGLLHPGLTGMAASGFRDTTRLAAGDPGLWTAIFLQNAPHLLHAIKNFEHRLADFSKAIAAGDAVTVQRLLTDAKGVRDDLGS